jgi:hypothetical protein
VLASPRVREGPNRLRSPVARRLRILREPSSLSWKRRRPMPKRRKMATAKKARSSDLAITHESLPTFPSAMA